MSKNFLLAQIVWRQLKLITKTQNILSQKEYVFRTLLSISLQFIHGTDTKELPFMIAKLC